MDFGQLLVEWLWLLPLLAIVFGLAAIVVLDLERKLRQNVEDKQFLEMELEVLRFSSTTHLEDLENALFREKVFVEEKIEQITIKNEVIEELAATGEHLESKLMFLEQDMGSLQEIVEARSSQANFEHQQHERVFRDAKAAIDHGELRELRLYKTIRRHERRQNEMRRELEHRKLTNKCIAFSIQFMQREAEEQQRARERHDCKHENKMQVANMAIHTYKQMQGESSQAMKHKETIISHLRKVEEDLRGELQREMEFGKEALENQKQEYEAEMQQARAIIESCQNLEQELKLRDAQVEAKMKEAAVLRNEQRETADDLMKEQVYTADLEEDLLRVKAENRGHTDLIDKMGEDLARLRAKVAAQEIEMGKLSLLNCPLIEQAATPELRAGIERAGNILRGRGATGEVWEWKGEAGCKRGRMAIKILRLDDLKQSGDRKNADSGSWWKEQVYKEFCKEGEQMMGLGEHHNLLQCFGIDCHPDGFNVSLQLELVDFDLNDVIEWDLSGEHGKIMHMGEGLNLLDQLTAGVSYIHRQGYIHKDLKPANIGVIWNFDGPQHYKLMDFGLLVEETVYGTFRPGGGTPGFRPGRIIGQLSTDSKEAEHTAIISDDCPNFELEEPSYAWDIYSIYATIIASCPVEDFDFGLDTDGQMRLPEDKHWEQLQRLESEYGCLHLLDWGDMKDPDPAARPSAQTINERIAFLRERLESDFHVLGYEHGRQICARNDALLTAMQERAEKVSDFERVLGPMAERLNAVKVSGKSM